MNPILIIENRAYRLSESNTLETVEVGGMVLGTFQVTPAESRNMTGGQDDAIRTWLSQANFAFPSGRKSKVEQKQMQGHTEKKREQVLSREHGPGAISKYLCTTCAKSIITIDRDEGTVWPQLPCNLTKHCRGKLRPQLYLGKEEPTHEWRLPTEEEIRLSGEGTLAYEYYRNQAGLILVPYSGAKVPRRKQAEVPTQVQTEKQPKVMASRRAKLGLEV